MSFKDNNKSNYMKQLDFRNDRENTKNDDIYIKKHLNSSFDLSSISVSEDLINRTLNAIRDREENLKDKIETAKAVKWYKNMRVISGIAVAVLLLVAGINTIGRMGVKYDKSTEDAGKSVAYDTSAADEGTTDLASGGGLEKEMEFKAIEESKSETQTAADVPPDADVDTDDASFNMASSILEKGAADNGNSDQMDNGDQVPDNTSPITSIPKDAKDPSSEDSSNESSEMASSEGTAKASDSISYGREANDKDNESDDIETSVTTLENESNMTFSDIFIADPEEVDFMFLKDVVNNTEIYLTSEDEIDALYSLMDQHLFIKDTQLNPSDGYIIEIKMSESEELNTIHVGGGININSITYRVEDEALLIEELSDFYLKNSY